MSAFATLPLAAAPTVVAPDGSTVRVLLGVAAGGMWRRPSPAPGSRP
jgi:hypothetical protein